MQVRNLIRYGKVSSVEAAKCRARVVYEDRDNLVSAELPILQGFGLKNRSYMLPDVGESVVCLMVPNGQDGQGFVIGSFYHEGSEPPASNQDVSCIRFEDGTSLSYNRATHELLIECVGLIRLKGRRIELN